MQDKVPRISINDLECIKRMNGSQEMWRLEGVLKTLLPDYEYPVVPKQVAVEGETKTMVFSLRRSEITKDPEKFNRTQINSYVPVLDILDTQGKKSSVSMILINVLEDMDQEYTILQSPLDQLKKSEDIQEYVFNWAQNKRKPGGGRDFDAPYGVLRGEHKNAKGFKYWGVTFGRAGTLDVSVDIYNTGFMLLRTNKASTKAYRNPKELMEELEKL